MVTQIPSLASPGKGYTMILAGGWEAGQMNDSQSYFFATDYYNSTRTLMTGFAYSSARIPQDGTIKNMFLRVRMSTIGTAETVSHFLRLNDTSDFGQIDMQYNNLNLTGAVFDLNQPIIAGDLIALKIQCPAWATNPIGTRCHATLYIE